MTTLDDDALTLLRILKELGADKEGQPIAKVTGMSRLSDNELLQAQQFLTARELIHGALGEGTLYWITPQGLAFLKSEMSNRLPLSPNAESILRYLITSSKYAGEGKSKAEVLSSLGMDEALYIRECQILDDHNLIEAPYATGELYGHIRETREGRKAVARNFARENGSSTHIQAGAIIHGSVTGGNIQAIASAMRSEISQSITTTDPDGIRNQISELLGTLVRTAVADLSIEKQAQYAGLAAEFKAEIAKADPNPTIIQKMLGLLGFFGDLDGAIELGSKGLELGAKVAPFVFMLQQAVLSLLNTPK